MSRRFHATGKFWEYNPDWTISKDGMTVKFGRLVEWTDGGIMSDSPQTYRHVTDEFEIEVFARRDGRLDLDCDFAIHVGIEEAREMWAGIKSGKLTYGALKARHEDDDRKAWAAYEARLPELRKIWAKEEEDRKARELEEEMAFQNAFLA